MPSQHIDAHRVHFFRLSDGQRKIELYLNESNNDMFESLAHLHGQAIRVYLTAEVVTEAVLAEEVVLAS